MKQLKFIDNLIPLILSGKKTSTWRLFDDKNLSVGDELIFINKATAEQFATAVITSIKEKSLSEINDEDFVGRERFKNTETMIKHFRLYYGSKVAAESTVKIINFKLL